MTVKLSTLSFVTLFMLAACGTVTNETVGTIVVDGEAFELRTRTIDGPNGTYDTTSVRVNSVYYGCIPTSRGDCEAAVRNGLEFPYDRE